MDSNHWICSVSSDQFLPRRLLLWLHWLCERRGRGTARVRDPNLWRRQLPPVKRFRHGSSTDLTLRLLIMNRILCHFKAHIKKLHTRGELRNNLLRSASPKNTYACEFCDYCERHTNLFTWKYGTMGLPNNPLAQSLLDGINYDHYS